MNTTDRIANTDIMAPSIGDKRAFASTLTSKSTLKSTLKSSPFISKPESVASPPQPQPQSQSQSQVPPSPSLSQSPSQISLSRPHYIINQYSLIFTLKRMIHPLLITPIFLFYIIPLLTSSFLSTLNHEYFSNDNAMVTFCITYGIIYYLKFYIVRYYAPSVEQYEKAMVSIGWYRLEVCVLVMVSWAVCYITTGLGLFLNGNENENENGNGDSGNSEGSYGWAKYIQKAEFLDLQTLIGSGWRVTFSFLLLSLLIGSRFIGCFSIGKF